MSDEFEPMETINGIIRRWPIVVFFGLLGALSGYGLSLQKAPIYKAAAVMSFGLDYDRDPPLRQREQDLAEGKVIVYLRSDEVLQVALDEVFPTLPGVIQALSVSEFRSMVQLERRISDWQLNVFGEDPALAASLANAWADAVEQAFREGYAHALRAVDIQTGLNHLAVEMAFLLSPDNPSSGNKSRIDDLESLIARQELLLEQEIEQTHGIVTFESLEVCNYASPPSEPISQDRNQLIMAGNLLGILVGFGLIVGMSSWRNRGSSVE